MTFGRRRHAATNSLLNKAFAEHGTLIMAHRGTSLGSIADNTRGSVRGALLSGADIVEIDVTGTTDGHFLAFHDGLEEEFLGTTRNVGTMTRAEADEQSFRWLNRPGRTVRLEDALELLAGFRGDVLFNLDRSWPWWPTFLPALDDVGMAGQLVLKCKAWDDAVEVLAEHPTKYPFMPICGSVRDVDAMLARDDLNVVGVELLAAEGDHPFVDADFIADVQARDAFVMVNAETLNTGVPLFAGFDDETAILQGPAAGWGPLFDLGVDVIQTDWPHVLAGYRRSRH